MDFYDLELDQQLEHLCEIALNALPHWGLDSESTVTAVKHRENAVFKVVTPEKVCYALRVHRLDYHTDAELQSEMQWMNAMRERGVMTPKPILSAQGQYVEVVTSTFLPEGRQVDMLEWIDCQPLGSIEDGIDNTEQYKMVGQLMAKLHSETEKWPLPENFTRAHWDVDGLLGKNPLWGRAWDHEDLTPEQRVLIIEARDQGRKVLSSIPKQAPQYGLIHCDFLPENLLVDGSGQIHLIDFDDAGFGYHMFDIATTVFWFMGDESFDDIVAQFLEGYESVRQLSDEQKELLPWFLLIRGMAYLGWGQTRSETDVAKEMFAPVLEAVTHLATMLLQPSEELA
ncbi:phosphotransferase enzyme family protein [Vibrio europaeus]|uniref:phosphotransferase enzyme family protein n=1 Tax=Vibrio europaeus TaxID=300876 RepID=UPI00233F68AA|nr:phosphotransferase [Vibrio europaeus]MDC5857316.1 phosphotransferase [Vibrio europaeus]